MRLNDPRGNRIVRRVLQLSILLSIFTSTRPTEYGNIVGEWKVGFSLYEGKDLILQTDSLEVVNLTIYNVLIPSDVGDFQFKVKSINEKVVFVNKTISRRAFVWNNLDGKYKWQGRVEVEGRWLGFSNLYLVLQVPQGNSISEEFSQESLDMTVIRPKDFDDRVFSFTSTFLVFLMFVNLGTILELKRLRAILLMPIGPLVGFCSRYVLMPLLSLGLGVLVFPNNKNFQLALFFTAISPNGGLANVCTIFLKGNINLSVANTTINGLLGIGMLPLWIFILARVVFRGSPVSVPIVDLSVATVGLIVFIATGIMLRIVIPKTTIYIFRFLKPLSIALSLCLVGFAVGINAFVFKQMSGMILLAAFCLPTGAYLLSYLLAKIFLRSPTDCVTVAVETSVLNMTAPIVLLQHGLGQPRADMTIIIPIMCALMSLFLISTFYIVRRVFGLNVKESQSFDTKQYVVME